MTKEELISKVALSSAISEEDALKIIDAFTNAIREELTRGGKVSIQGFGSFMISRYSAKVTKNPKTGQPMNLPERNVPRFRPGPTFKKGFK